MSGTVLEPTTDWKWMATAIPKDEFQVATDLYDVNVVKHQKTQTRTHG